MNTTRNCPECGLPLPDGVAEGLCMHCLLGAGVSETITESKTERDDRPGTRTLPDFGTYHTMGVLGEGGMGIVYLAEQRQPVRRRVALKVLKSAELGSTVLARFESESQALALMDHPNIAQIYDAGTTSGGRPFFAMEYVPGIPITDYCDRNLLGFQDRLALFQQVCQAVHHAHQKGVIHRDIKPSNVLVMLQDGKPVPKVIDFGVAKALNQRLAEKTLFTEIGMIIGTPEYMSPEQADLTGLDIDSTTDIYSLGVLLYELLVGALPFDSKTLRKAGYAEIQRIIRETEPPRLATRLSSLGDEAAQEAARQRQSDVRSMARLLRGDLEWITMKALEKNRTRRYASASEFAADIGRHLTSEPVLAGPPDLGYKVQKFVRRNKGLVFAGSAVTATLLIGLIVSSALFLKASKQQEIAESESYSANLSAAEIQLRAGQISEARYRLSQTSPKFRGWEWQYLMARTDESTATFYNVSSREISLSEDGSKIFSYGTTAFRSWDSSTRRMVYDTGGPVRTLAIGGHGRTVLIASPPRSEAALATGAHSLGLYDVAAGRVVASFQMNAGNPDRAAISEDGRFLAASTAAKADGGVSIAVWEQASGKLLVEWDGMAPSNTTFSPDGELFAAASLDKTLRIWDVNHRESRAVLKPGGFAAAVAFSNDGRLLASGTADGRVEIWNPKTGASLLQWQASASSRIGAIAFSPDSSLLATCSGERVMVWDVQSGRLRNSFNGHQDVWEVVFHPAAPKLYTSSYGVIKEWDLGRTVTVADETGPSKLVFSPDGQYFAKSSEGRVELYDAKTVQLVRGWGASSDAGLAAVAFSPDSLLVASSSLTSGSASVINIWNVSDGTLVKTLTGYAASPTSIVFSPDGAKILSGSEDRRIRISDVISSAPPTVIGANGPIDHVAVSPDGGTWLALRRTDKAIALWDAATNRAAGTLETNTLEIESFSHRSMALSPKGEILIGPADTGHAIAIWDLPKRRLRQLLEVFHGPDSIASLAVSPDGSRAAVGGTKSGNIFIWDLLRGKLLVTLEGHGGLLYWLAWSPDGTRLISSGGHTVRIWDARSTYNYEAELLVDTAFEDRLLVDEVVTGLNGDPKIPASLRKEAIQVATKRGDRSFGMLQIRAWYVAAGAGRSREEYLQALRLAKIASDLAPWFADATLAVGLADYRLGEFDQALAASQRAMDLLKKDTAKARSIRAMAFYQLHDVARARQEVEAARKAADQGEDKEDRNILEEAEALIGVAREPQQQ